MLQIYRSQINYEYKFRQIRDRLLPVIGDKVTIQHVGSTALKNVDGKGIIDILVGVDDGSKLVDYRDKLIANGYFSKPSDNHGDYIFLSSTDAETTIGDHHIHLALANSKKYIEYIKLRDYFTNNPDKAREYSDLKHKLVEQTCGNRHEYRRLKSEYIEKILRIINR